VTTTDGVAAWQRSLQSAALLIAPPALIAGLLAYFGRVRVQAQYAALGFDASILALPTDYYIQTSITPMFWPLVWLLVALLAAAWTHALVVRATEHGTSTRVRDYASALTIVGAIMLALAMRASFWTGKQPVIPARLTTVDTVSLRPVAFMLAISAIAYGVYLLPIRSAAPTSWLWQVSLLCVALLLAGGLFWAVANYALAFGERRADAVIRGGFREYRSVVIYSERDLTLEDAGATTVRTDGMDVRYRYRTSGFRLVTTHEQVYVLIAPAGWTEQDPIVVVLNSAEDFRIQFGR
jgi:hypothetical protein